MNRFRTLENIINSEVKNLADFGTLRKEIKILFMSVDKDEIPQLSRGFEYNLSYCYQHLKDGTLKGTNEKRFEEHRIGRHLIIILDYKDFIELEENKK